MDKMNLSEAEREELMAMQRSRTMAVGQVRRARLILLLDHGASREAIMNELRCDSRFITTWKTRFASERLAGPYGRHPGRAPRRDLARLEAQVLDYTLRRKPQDGSTHWSSRNCFAVAVPAMSAVGGDVLQDTVRPATTCEIWYDSQGAARNEFVNVCSRRLLPAYVHHRRRPSMEQRPCEILEYTDCREETRDSSTHPNYRPPIFGMFLVEQYKLPKALRTEISVKHREEGKDQNGANSDCPKLQFMRPMKREQHQKYSGIQEIHYRKCPIYQHVTREQCRLNWRPSFALNVTARHSVQILHGCPGQGQSSFQSFLP
jgi:hypothetical protein